MEKPRVRFCWECGNKLRGNHHKTVLADGHERIVHKECEKAALGLRPSLAVLHPPQNHMDRSVQCVCGSKKVECIEDNVLNEQFHCLACHRVWSD